MAEERASTAEWLSDEDLACFEGLLSRLDWLAERAPPGEFWTFPGGLLAKSVFEESRYCFVYGQFIATTLLGLAYVERTLAALFYGAGRNDLERASFARLLKEARKARLISEAEFEDLERIRESRNSYAHSGSRWILPGWSLGRFVGTKHPTK